MNVTIYAVQLGWWMRGSATTGHWGREIERNVRISTLLPICNVFQEVFGLDFQARSAETEGVVLDIGVTVAGMVEVTNDTPRWRCIRNNSTR
jgi:hypothetical protein